ncbi:MAG: DNA repair protein RadC [Candidatus Paceibacterota bacterium]
MTKIKDLPKIDRPREKLIKYGVSKISNSELLGIIIGSGSRNMNVVDLSRMILKKYKSSNIKDVEIKDLLKMKGLGEAKATKIVASMELGRRLLKDTTGTRLKTLEDIWKSCSDLWGKKKEYTRIFYLNARDEEIDREIISIGILNSNLIHPREVFESAIKNHAAKIVMVHNHPSGDPTPSDDDIAVTQRIYNAGEMMGIRLEDHVIVTRDKYVSMRNLGLFS